MFIFIKFHSAILEVRSWYTELHSKNSSEKFYLIIIIIYFIFSYYVYMCVFV